MKTGILINFSRLQGKVTMQLIINWKLTQLLDHHNGNKSTAR